MKFCEIKGERALEVMSELIEPISNIALDEDAANLFQAMEKPKDMDANQFIMHRLKKAYPALFRTHRQDLIKIAAMINDCTEAEYTATMTMQSILEDVAALMQDPYFRSFFAFAPTASGKVQSGDSAENTQA